MDNLKEYKEKLEHLTNKLLKYNLNNADTDHKELKILFDAVYESGILKLYEVNKEYHDLYKLELFTRLSQVSGTLSFLVIQILAANNIMAKNKLYQKRALLQ